MGTTVLGKIASDLEEVAAPANGATGEWPGTRRVMRRPDGSRWGWPGGRPEPGESWEDTLRREMLEEACATVTGARLLGFVRSRCITGPEKGLVLVRSIWRAQVRLLPWQPEYEIPFRR